MRAGCKVWRRVGMQLGTAWVLGSVVAPLYAAPPAFGTSTSSDTGHGFSFAVFGDLPHGPGDLRIADTVIGSLSLGDIAFAIDLGNIKGVEERCSDRLYEQRYDWLARAPVPLIYLPGENDWIACALHTDEHNEFSDPNQRLEALRTRFFPDTEALGAPGLRLSRQSSLAGFHAYRENVRWMHGGVAFITVNAPGLNNHYLKGGGRNGEYEDREVATRVWLERALSIATRDRARALIVAMGGSPWPTPHRVFSLAWLKTLTSQEIDGYKHLREQLARLAHQFDGPVYLVHRTGDGSRQAGLAIELLPRRGAGRRELDGSPWQTRTGWLRVTVPAGAHPALRAHWVPVEPDGTVRMPADARADGPAGTVPNDAPAAANVRRPVFLPLPDEHTIRRTH